MRHADLRQRLLRAAEQEIMANGLARTSLRGIARRVGVSHQATAHHFDDRAGLFTALAIEGFETLCERTREAIATVADAQQPAMVGMAYLDFAQRHPTMFDVMFRPELLHGEDERLVAARRTHRDLLVGALEVALATGWGPQMPADELATIGWATMHGLAVLQRDAQLTDTLPEVDPGQLMDRVARSLDVPGLELSVSSSTSVL